MKPRKQGGFTLIEIMIVVAIIALLAAIAIPNVLRGRTTANESAAIGNLRALVSSLEMYRSVNQAYPTAAGTAANTYRAVMYGTNCAAGTAPDPDFGPPSFCIALDGSNAVGNGLMQGFIYAYTGVAGGATYNIATSPQTTGSTGTRSFYADQTGLLRNCTCSDATDCPTAVTSATAATSASNTIDQTPNTTCP